MGMRLTVDDLLFIGIKGTVLALARTSGQEIWRTKLKGCSFTNLVQEGKLLLASAQGELFCLDAASGRVLWHNPLKGMGFGLITIANAAQAPAAAQKLADDDAATTAATMHTTPTS